MLDRQSDDRNINYGLDELAMEDNESHGTVSESCIEGLFKIRHCIGETAESFEINWTNMQGAIK